MNNGTIERLEMARVLELRELGIRPDSEQATSVRVIRRRFDFLCGKLRRGEHSDGSRCYLIADIRATHQALTAMEDRIAALCLSA